MPWKHAGRQDYNLEEDSKIFMVSVNVTSPVQVSRIFKKDASFSAGWRRVVLVGGLMPLQKLLLFQ